MRTVRNAADCVAKGGCDELDTRCHTRFLLADRHLDDYLIEDEAGFDAGVSPDFCRLVFRPASSRDASY